MVLYYGMAIGIFGSTIGILGLIISIVLGLFSFVLWLIMLIDVIKGKFGPWKKFFWVLAMIFFHIVAAVIYYFETYRKDESKKKLGWLIITIFALFGAQILLVILNWIMISRLVS